MASAFVCQACCATPRGRLFLGLPIYLIYLLYFLPFAMRPVKCRMNLLIFHHRYCVYDIEISAHYRFHNSMIFIRSKYFRTHFVLAESTQLAISGTMISASPWSNFLTPTHVHYGKMLVSIFLLSLLFFCLNKEDIRKIFLIYLLQEVMAFSKW